MGVKFGMEVSALVGWELKKWKFYPVLEYKCPRFLILKWFLNEFTQITERPLSSGKFARHFSTPSFVNSLQNLKYVNTLNKYVMSDGTKNV